MSPIDENLDLLSEAVEREFSRETIYNILDRLNELRGITSTEKDVSERVDHLIDLPRVVHIGYGNFAHITSLPHGTKIPLADFVRRGLYIRSDKVQTIKNLRREYGMSLKGAKDFVEVIHKNDSGYNNPYIRYIEI